MIPSAIESSPRLDREHKGREEIGSIAAQPAQLTVEEEAKWADELLPQSLSPAIAHARPPPGEAD
eukprot:12421008-Karenia_brevis.AAC.1